MAARRVYRITGKDRETFLQNLVTNDVGRLKDGLVWTALLSPQGKYLADFFLVPDGEAILLDVDADLGPGLAQRLGMYLLRADARIEETDMDVARGTGAAPDGAFGDPRHPDLGWRAYDGRAGEDADWEAVRIRAGVPESGVDLIPNDSYPLETGFERFHGVDFRKGCYVGQEVTARMKHKTDLRKGLARVSLTGNARPGAAIMSDDGREAGVLRSVAGDRGLAYLRFDRTGGSLTADGAAVEVLDQI